MESNEPNYEEIRQELLRMIEKPGYDDGSLAPILIRLTWHASGTFNKYDRSGGSNGATMRFKPESDDPENAGLEVARTFLEPLKRKFASISYADLWILAAYVGIEHTGGPKIPFKGGRRDAKDGSECPPIGRLPQPDLGMETGETPREQEKKTIDGIRQVFGRMGFDDRETVALIAGGHVYGRCHPERSGYAGPWVENPIQFSNEYCADLIEDDWKEITHDSPQVADGMRPIPGKRQYNNDGGKGKQMMLISDMALVWDDHFRQVVEEFARDEELLKKEFGIAFKKLTELGLHKSHL